MKLSRVIVWSLSAALFAFAVSGCTTQEEFRAAFYSTRIGGEVGDSNDDRSGKRSWDGDYSALTLDVQPFALGAWKMQADIQARASVEAQYAARVGPPEPKPCHEKPK